MKDDTDVKRRVASSPCREREYLAPPHLNSGNAYRSVGDHEDVSHRSHYIRSVLGSTELTRHYLTKYYDVVQESCARWVRCRVHLVAIRTHHL